MSFVIQETKSKMGGGRQYQRNLPYSTEVQWDISYLHFLLLNNRNDINYGHVIKCVMLSIGFWTIYLYDLA